MSLYFEPRNFGLQNDGDAYSYTSSGSTMRFEVRRGDQPSFDSSSVERSEITSGKEIEFGKTYTLSYKFLIEPGAKLTSKWMLLGQVHHRNDPGESGGSPPFGIEVNGETMRVIARSGTEAIRKSNPDAKTLWKDDAPLQRGKWYDMKFELEFDPFGKGLVNMWIDGKQELAYTGALGYNDKEGGYLKMGIYRKAAPETVAVKYDSVEMIQGTRADITPAPTPTAKIFAAPIEQGTIDVSEYDANRGVSGDQAFTFIGKEAFTKAGQLHFFHDTDKGITVIEGNTDADLTPEVHLESRGLVSLQVADFVL
jgi:hypothetical protein